jgi:hypothetical protein
MVGINAAEDGTDPDDDIDRKSRLMDVAEPLQLWKLLAIGHGRQRPAIVARTVIDRLGQDRERV